MKENTDNSWVSFSDIMTGLMVIFLFISISYMMQIQKEQNSRDLIFEEFKATKDDLYAELQQEFRDDFRRWDMELDKDLSIKFTNPDVLFQSGKSNIRPNFAQILDRFLPRYINTLLKPKYRDKILEIRIEGHTDDVPVSSRSKTPYIDNLKLSQERSTSVMKYFVQSDFYKNLDKDKRKWLLFHFTSNGLSYGRTLDADKNYTYQTNKTINRQFSRRVEFRIVTTTEKLVNEILQRIQNEKKK